MGTLEGNFGDTPGVSVHIVADAMQPRPNARPGYDNAPWAET